MTDVQRAQQSAVRRVSRSDSTIECGGARVRAYARSVATVVAVSGDLDASNVVGIDRYIRRFVSLGTPVLLDFTGVDCLAVEGLRVLFAFDDECGEAGVDWLLVTSPSVSMTLRAGDRDGILPTADSVVDALRWFRDRTRQRGLLQFVSHKTQAGE